MRYPAYILNTKFLSSEALKRLLSLSMLFSVGTYGYNPALDRANNQTFIEGLAGHSRQNYNNNHPADAGVPLYNGQSNVFGAQGGVTKTFDRIYTQLGFTANSGLVNYTEQTNNSTSLSNGSLVNIGWLAKLGYQFNLGSHNALFTPYLLGGYSTSQLDTGGFSANFIHAHYNGGTLATRAWVYGLGLLNQWAASPLWVISADLQLASQYHPWVDGNVNNFNIPSGATTSYQRWDLSPGIIPQLTLGSDYRIAEHLHVRGSVTYRYHHLNGANSSADGIYPAQTNSDWLLNLGLGYDFADAQPENLTSRGGQKAIYAANNQAGIRVGYQALNFSGGTNINHYTQSGGLPSLGIVFSKTWHTLYLSLALSEAMGQTAYHGPSGHSSTQNTLLNTSAKIGYQIASSTNTALIPYATLGYRYWAMDIPGAPSQHHKIDGSIDSYQHNWVGIGLRAEWAASSKLVLNADGNIGSTFNARLHNWAPLGVTINSSYGLSSAGYQMLTLGGDYLLSKRWHAQASVGYEYARYNSSGANSFGVTPLRDSMQQWGAELGLGYALS